MKNILIIIMILALSACSSLRSREISPEIKLVSEIVYPNLPDMPYPRALQLQSIPYDVPRNTSVAMVVKKLTDCLKVAEDNRDNSFWRECGEYPITLNSNVYRGFSYENFQIFLINMKRIRKKLKEYKVRIDEINSQREQWRLINMKSKTINKYKEGK